jgi:hypothetical protein
MLISSPDRYNEGDKMKTVTVDFPVISWATQKIEVEDNLSPEEVQELIEEGSLEIAWDGKLQFSMPVFDIRQLPTDIGEVPECFEVSEG